MTPEYWRDYRKRNRDKINARDRARRARGRDRGDRSAEYAKRNAERAAARPNIEPLPVLYPELNHGTSIAFWHDELRMDLAQERILAELEGRDPDEAVRAYTARENAWDHMTNPLLDAA